MSPRQLRQSTQRIEKMTVETEAFLEDVEAGRVIIRNVVLCHLQSGGTFALGVSGKKSTTFKTKFTIWRGHDIYHSMICKKWFFMVHPQFMYSIYANIIICPTKKTTPGPLTIRHDLTHLAGGDFAGPRPNIPLQCPVTPRVACNGHVWRANGATSQRARGHEIGTPTQTSCMKNT